MRIPLAVLLLAIVCLQAQQPQKDDNWQTWVNWGIQAFRAARYQEAAEAFQNAVNLAPDEAVPHLHLGATWLAEYVPGAPAPENLEIARKAEREFREVLQIEPQNETAIVSLASLAYQDAAGQQDTQQKSRMLDESAAWYKRAIAVNPQNKESYYSLGVIGWMKWYPAWIAARAQLGMRPETPGPLTDPTTRSQLKAQYSALLDQAILNLNKALELDPMYADAMAYMNLLVRGKADLDDTADEYAMDIEAADGWITKSLDTRRKKAAASIQRYDPATAGHRRIHVDSAEQEAKLIWRVDPTYPTEPRVRVKGAVRLRVIIGVDGRVQSLQLESGHPLLVKPAMDAVRQWEYSPTFLNGQAVEVETHVDVNFVKP